MFLRITLLAASLLGFGALAQLAAVKPAPEAPASAITFKDARWEDLAPKDWNPYARFKGMNLALMNDSDPRLQQMMSELRDELDRAPTNPAMEGAAVRLPGYVVPLEEVKGELKEFLLVPYFGACIHSPPPPANQIVHVVLARPLKGLRTMDTVWASGTLKPERKDSTMGTSGYRMDAVIIDRYVPPRQPK